ncbi:MAG TPA: NUDIX hydrolase [Dermatophilaceae bacterium]|nr:NUDIX hydrolase [Dermatophilaceae bacterium]
MTQPSGSPGAAGATGATGATGPPPGGRPAGHPDASTEEGRRLLVRALNSRLPTKRAIAQGVLRNVAGEVLFCQLTYKREWDLPGGVVDPSESPATCVVREVFEELGVEVTVRRLLAVNWLPPWRGWDDAVLFLFDLGTVPDDFLARARLLPREIRAVHWRSPGDAEPHLAPYTARMLEVALDLEHPAYLENSEHRGTGG